MGAIFGCSEQNKQKREWKKKEGGEELPGEGETQPINTSRDGHVLFLT